MHIETSSPRLPAAACLRPRSEAIVDAAWLQAQIGQATRPIVVHAGWAAPGAAEYRAGHLPGAIFLDTDVLEDGYPTWRLRPDGELQSALGALGIRPAATVVVYGAQTIAAARAWWVLLYAGVADVRYLDGGLAAWRAAGGAVETKSHRPGAVSFRTPARHALRAGTLELRAALADARLQRGDVRSCEEFTGASSGYDYVAFAGRIPGAIALGDADDSACIYQRPDGRLRDPREIDAFWRSVGLDPARGVAFYCGTGWRSSLAFLYAWTLGFGRLSNYSDGWAAWSTVHVPDTAAGLPTPGWQQLRSTNPVAGAAR